MAGEKKNTGWSEKLKSGLAFSFGDLVDDIGGWLLIGVLLAGLISVFISPALVETYLSNELLSMLFMLLIATPLYVCATASTPIAAALVLKGISPGAALVFLLAGPATNVATITVVARVIGKKATLLYVGSILICSLAMGVLVNTIYRALGIDIVEWTTRSEAESFGVVAYLSTFILLALIVRGGLRRVKTRIHAISGISAR